MFDDNFPLSQKLACFFLRAGTVGKTITISRSSQGTIFSVSLWNFDNTILIRLPICFELRITVVNVICNCVCHRTIKVPAADHSKHRRIANYRVQLSVLWQFGCLSLSIHKLKKRIIVQNVNQRPYVYFKWTLKSSFCSHTKKKEIRCFNCSVHCLFYPLFLHPCNWTFPLSHSHSAIYFLLNSSNNWPLHYFIHARRLLLYSLTWQHIALFFNYNKGSV